MKRDGYFHLFFFSFLKFSSGLVICNIQDNISSNENYFIYSICNVLLTSPLIYIIVPLTYACRTVVLCLLRHVQRSVFFCWRASTFFGLKNKKEKKKKKYTKICGFSRTKVRLHLHRRYDYFMLLLFYLNRVFS